MELLSINLSSFFTSADTCSLRLNDQPQGNGLSLLVLQYIVCRNCPALSFVLADNECESLYGFVIGGVKI